MRIWPAVLLAPLLIVGACSSPGPSTTQRASAAPTPSGHATVGPASRTRVSDWPTYHRHNSRSGKVRYAAVPPLHAGWSDGLRGAVYGEPLVIHHTLVVATERNYVYGLSARTGRHLWRKHLGRAAPLSTLPCGDIDPLGITGTPAYDASTGSVFVAAETAGGHHTLWALGVKTGHRRWHRSLDTQPHRNRKAEQERSALLVTHGRVVTAFGGLAGDCNNYVGYVTSVSTSGHGFVRQYAVPTAREAGMWSPAGPVVGANGNLYVASGNGAEEHGRWDKSDSVTELTPTLLRRVAVFAPRTWKQDNIDDLDLGSSSPISVPLAHRLVIAGKRGTVYLLRPGLGGVGSAVTKRAGCQAYGGGAVLGHTVLLPCKGEREIRVLRVREHSLRWGWTAKDLYASPVIAGRFVYVADEDTGDLVVLRLSTGHIVQRLHAGPLPHFPSEVVTGGRVYVPTLDGITSFAGS